MPVAGRTRIVVTWPVVSSTSRSAAVSSCGVSHECAIVGVDGGVGVVVASGPRGAVSPATGLAGLDGRVVDPAGALVVAKEDEVLLVLAMFPRRRCNGQVSGRTVRDWDQAGLGPAQGPALACRFPRATALREQREPSRLSSHGRQPPSCSRHWPARAGGVPAASANHADEPALPFNFCLVNFGWLVLFLAHGILLSKCVVSPSSPPP